MEMVKLSDWRASGERWSTMAARAEKVLLHRLQLA
jgi:hypothetical protein